MAGIGSLRETSLHASLKSWWAHPGDLLEAKVDGYVVDLLRGETVIEIQTGHFSAIRPKLHALLACRPVCLVHPIAVERWIVRLDADCQTPLGRRNLSERIWVLGMAVSAIFGLLYDGTACPSRSRQDSGSWRPSARRSASASTLPPTPSRAGD